MDVDAIIREINDTLLSLSEEERIEVENAFTSDMPGDVAIEDYLLKFADEYFYCETLQNTSCFSADLTLNVSDSSGCQIHFEGVSHSYKANVQMDAYSSGQSNFNSEMAA